MADMSDLEGLLEERPQEVRYPRALRLAVGGCVLLALAAFAAHSSTPLRAGKAFVTLDQDMACFEEGMYYAEPTKLEGTARTVEMTAEACQQRCQVIEECAHFTFWPDGGCMLTGETSYPKAAPVKYAATKTGPKFCGVQSVTDDDDDDDDELPEASGAQAAATWGEGATAVTPAPSVPEALPGINGTTCSAYPACVAAGISGNCCPNDESVSLGCCNGFPLAVAEVKIAVGSECSKFPACVVLNISGACCPTADGIKLGCCEPI